MKKITLIMAVLLMVFCGCKKDEPEQEQPEYLTADFSVKIGFTLRDGEFSEEAFSVVVTDLSKKAESYLWEWGDGESSRGTINWTVYEYVTYNETEWGSEGGMEYVTYYGNTHRYSEAGTYTITLTVSNGEGETDVKSKTINVL